MGENKVDVMKSFDFDGSGVRVSLSAAGAPLFVAKDVCEVLGIANCRDAVSSLDEDEKASVGIPDTSSSSRNTVPMVVVNESGLYHLIFKSRKDAAKRFRRWVTMDVLPELRKQGFYAVVGNTELMTLPSWLEGQGVDVRKEKAKAKRLLKEAWEASSLMGYKGVRGADGFVKFPSSVLDMAEDSKREELSDGVLMVLRKLECGEYSVDEMAKALGVDGTVQGKRCYVGKVLPKYYGDLGGGKFLERLPKRRHTVYVIKLKIQK